MRTKSPTLQPARTLPRPLLDIPPSTPSYPITKPPTTIANNIPLEVSKGLALFFENAGIFGQDHRKRHTVVVQRLVILMASRVSIEGEEAKAAECEFGVTFLLFLSSGLSHCMCCA